MRQIEPTFDEICCFSIEKQWFPRKSDPRFGLGSIERLSCSCHNRWINRGGGDGRTPGLNRSMHSTCVCRRNPRVATIPGNPPRRTSQRPKNYYLFNYDEPRSLRRYFTAYPLGYPRLKSLSKKFIVLCARVRFHAHSCQGTQDKIAPTSALHNGNLGNLCEPTVPLLATIAPFRFHNAQVRFKIVLIRDFSRSAGFP